MLLAFSLTMIEGLLIFPDITLGKSWLPLFGRFGGLI